MVVREALVLAVLVDEVRDVLAVEVEHQHVVAQARQLPENDVLLALHGLLRRLILLQLVYFVAAQLLVYGLEYAALPEVAVLPNWVVDQRELELDLLAALADDELEAA